MRKALTLNIIINNRTYCARGTKTEPGCPALATNLASCGFWNEDLVVTQIATYTRTCRSLRCIEFETAIERKVKT